MKTAEYGFSNEKMSDIQLDDLGHGGDGVYRIESQSMARMHLKPGRSRRASAFRQPIDFTSYISAVAMQDCLATGAGVKFDNIRANR